MLQIKTLVIAPSVSAVDAASVEVALLWGALRALEEGSSPAEQPQPSETKLSELYPNVKAPTAAAQDGCPGGPIAWNDGAQTYVCYYCRRAWYACAGILKRGKALHAGCLSASVDVHVLYDPLRAHLTCSDCGKAWAPFPRQSESRACNHAERAAHAGLLHRDPSASSESVKKCMLSARVAACATFGGFVHGDEGLGCWRCGADRQAHS